MKLLFVDCCVSQRGKDSRTLALAERYMTAFREKHPEAEVERVDAGALKLAPFTAETLTERDALAQRGEFSAPVFALARQFAAADSVVVAAPFWDLSYPAQLKLYIEHVSANGVCYHYDQTGCHGDCRAAAILNGKTLWVWSIGGSFAPGLASLILIMCLPAGWISTLSKRRTFWKRPVKRPRPLFDHRKGEA